MNACSLRLPGFFLLAAVGAFATTGCVTYPDGTVAFLPPPVVVGAPVVAVAPTYGYRTYYYGGNYGWPGYGYARPYWGGYRGGYYAGGYYRGGGYYHGGAYRGGYVYRR